jgi:hypothetical protein
MGKRRRVEISTPSITRTVNSSPSTGCVTSFTAHTVYSEKLSTASPNISSGKARLARGAAVLQRYHNDAVQSSAEEHQEQANKEVRIDGHVQVPACAGSCSTGKW